jgi:hypothetical protein
MAVEDTGGPLKAPVGKAVLSRMFDVFGNTIDREAALSDVESVRCIGLHRRWRDVPPSRKSLRQALRSLMSLYRWSAAAEDRALRFIDPYNRRGRLERSERHK